MKSKKIWLVLVTIIASMLLAACGDNESTPSEIDSKDSKNLEEIKIGYQKGMPVLSLLKEKSDLEERLNEEGYTVVWNEFAATPAMLEAMVEGGIVFGGGGATGSIFAQEAERSFVRVGAQTGVSGGSAVIVQDDADIQTLADLKGKVVAVAKGTTQHYMLEKGLEKEGLTIDDVTLKYINPAEAFPAFGKGEIDAWSIWDPFTAEAEISFDARIIADNSSVFGEEEAKFEGENLYYAERTFANENPEVIDIILDELKVVGKWNAENEEEAAEILANLYSADVETLKITESRGGTREILPMSEVTIEPLQNISTFFYKEKILTTELDASDPVYNWSSKE